MDGKTHEYHYVLVHKDHKTFPPILVEYYVSFSLVHLGQIFAENIVCLILPHERVLLVNLINTLLMSRPVKNTKSQTLYVWAIYDGYMYLL